MRLGNGIVKLTQYTIKLLAVFIGTIELSEMVEIIGTLYEMEGVSKVLFFF
jgi:hypothetical protein